MFRKGRLLEFKVSPLHLTEMQAQTGRRAFLECLIWWWSWVQLQPLLWSLRMAPMHLLSSQPSKTAPGRIWQTSCPSNINNNRKDSMDFIHFAESLSSYSGTRFGAGNVVHAILILIGQCKLVWWVLRWRFKKGTCGFENTTQSA